jgi:hypothetical protein
MTFSDLLWDGPTIDVRLTCLEKDRRLAELSELVTACLSSSYSHSPVNFVRANDLAGQHKSRCSWCHLAFEYPFCLSQTACECLEH